MANTHKTDPARARQGLGVHSRAFWYWLAFSVVVGVGAFLRLMWLGEAAFGTDTMTFFDLCHRPVSGWVIFTKWLEVMGPCGQFPFAAAFTKGFIDLFGLPVTDFTIRLPMALFGIAAVPAAALAASLLGGKRFGLFVGLLLALNPFHIQLSRIVYFYQPYCLGSALMMWAVLWIFQRRNRAVPLPVLWYLVTAAGLFMMIYSHVTAWWLAFLVVIFTMTMVIWRVKHRLGRPSEIIVLASIYLLIGGPLLVFPWAVPSFVNGLMHPDELGKDYFIRMFGGENTLSMWTMVSSTATIWAWGNTVMRASFTGGVVALTLGVILFRYKANRSAAIILGLFLVADLMYYVSRPWLAMGFTARHQAVLLPLYLMLLAYGIWHLGSLGRLTRRLSPLLRRGAAWAIAGAAILLYLDPAFSCIRVTGTPMPLKDLARWCDTHLPRHSLVLVDRWFDPWNELRVNNSTNVYFTFTVPNEPKDVFLKAHWRDTAMAFCENYPDAAYYERGSLDNDDVAGHAAWRSQYFARTVTFTNEAGLHLLNLGLNYCYSPREPDLQVRISLYYNTMEDVLAKARNQGKSALVIFGPEWGYVKLWQQYRDFRDWRILEDKATLDVYNLTAQTNMTSLLIRGMSVNGGKRVRLGMLGQANFQNSQMAEWRIDRVPLKPGLNQLVLTDEFWTKAKAPLLVDQVRVLAEEVRGQPAVSTVEPRSEVSKR